ncbi:hypothetical protein Msil_1710 [Methylocella silvestris BL2]|uniref:Uncharacterized protein n=1 Tax=Methylocella silvestris (strain DSM 15510 / CIP 108128 / LMG 27833 / NCIMB 13906 / BL2) TaxID=395965 RepID=B8EKB7_METSB|nr:hypothetical protein [Methylocella silvestris]ACK50657.1 hypothetical protein Msil_1710 [Methylocella silvestris BL2]
MLHKIGELKAQREQIALLVRHSEDDLTEVRNSPALGGRSRSILLQLERRLQANRKDLAALDAQLARVTKASEAVER